MNTVKMSEKWAHETSLFGFDIARIGQEYPFDGDGVVVELVFWIKSTAGGELVPQVRFGSSLQIFGESLYSEWGEYSQKYDNRVSESSYAFLQTSLISRSGSIQACLTSSRFVFRGDSLTTVLPENFAADSENL